jgi:hypothetical protein
MRCTRPNRHGQQCFYGSRFSSLPHSHHCEFHSLNAPELSQPQIERSASLPLEQRAQAEFASLTAFMDAPLEIVEDGFSIACSTHLSSSDAKIVNFTSVPVGPLSPALERETLLLKSRTSSVPQFLRSLRRSHACLLLLLPERLNDAMLSIL